VKFQIYKITNFKVTRQGATRSTVYHVMRSVTDFTNWKQEYCTMSSQFNVIAVSPQTHCNPSSYKINKYYGCCSWMTQTKMTRLQHRTTWKTMYIIRTTVFSHDTQCFKCCTVKIFMTLLYYKCSWPLTRLASHLLHKNALAANSQRWPLRVLTVWLMLKTDHQFNTSV